MPHEKALRPSDPVQNHAYHRRKPHQGTGRISSCKLMYKSTVEDGYQKGKITETAFADLSAACDTVNHRLLIQKLYNTTQDNTLCRVEILLKVVWNETEIENTIHQKYHGVTLDRSPSCKHRIENTKMKLATRNNILTKLATFKWGANPSTIRTTALALSYSTAENDAPVWERSPYAKTLNLELNQACRSVTECLKPTSAEDLYLLSGIASPVIRRDVCARVEIQKESSRGSHSLFRQIPATKCLTS